MACLPIQVNVRVANVLPAFGAHCASKPPLWQGLSKTAMSHNL